MIKTPLFDYIKNVMENNMIPLDDIPGGGIIEEIWLLEMIFTLEERYKKSGML